MPRTFRVSVPQFRARPPRGAARSAAPLAAALGGFKAREHLRRVAPEGSWVVKWDLGWWFE